MPLQHWKLGFDRRFEAINVIIFLRKSYGLDVVQLLDEKVSRLAKKERLAAERREGIFSYSFRGIMLSLIIGIRKTVNCPRLVLPLPSSSSIKRCRTFRWAMPPRLASVPPILLRRVPCPFDVDDLGAS